MQTSNLSNSALGRSGEVMTALPEKAFSVRDSIFERDEMISRFCCGDDVILDYRDGMSLLILYEDDTPHAYYLDRIVRLHKNVLFSVSPIGDKSRVRFLLPEECELTEYDRIPASFLDQSSPSLGFGRVYTFFCQEAARNFYFRGESHDPYELVYVDNGILHNLVDGRDIVLHQQECLIIEKNSWHIQFSDEPVRFLTVSFDLQSQYPDTLTNHALPIRQDLKPIFEKMVHELDRDSFSTDYIESLMKILLIEFIRQPMEKRGSAKYPATYHSESEIVNGILKQISRHISSKIEIGKLAEQAHISVPYLYVLFDRHLGMPPGKFILKIRIEESKLLLQEGELTVGAVADKMGFSSIQLFSKQFRSVCGISPSEYIKSLR